MSAEETITGWLEGRAQLVSLLGGEDIFPGALPMDVVLPAIAYARQQTEYIPLLSGGIAGSFVPIQIQAWAKTQTEADAVADEVVLALIANGEVPVNRGVVFDHETGNFGTAVDVRLLVT